MHYSCFCNINTMASFTLKLAETCFQEGKNLVFNQQCRFAN
jgi:hypothetical protein